MSIHGSAKKDLDSFLTNYLEIGLKMQINTVMFHIRRVFVLHLKGITIWSMCHQGENRVKKWKLVKLQISVLTIVQYNAGGVQIITTTKLRDTCLICVHMLLSLKGDRNF